MSGLACGFFRPRPFPCDHLLHGSLHVAVEDVPAHVGRELAPKLLVRQSFPGHGSDPVKRAKVVDDPGRGRLFPWLALGSEQTQVVHIVVLGCSKEYAGSVKNERVCRE